jgi:SARP family transcriptional regulator, regulator of embCAB operon
MRRMIRSRCCGAVGEMLSRVSSEYVDCRVYLCGRVTVERDGRALTDGALAGPQGRLLLAFLGTRRTQPSSKSQVIEALWGERTPPSADTTINALVSKVRSALKRLGIPPPYGVATEVGTYQFMIPSTWIDIEHARTAIDRGEGALRRDALNEAWSNANVAAIISRQPFLPDEQQPWIEQQRTINARVLRRARLVLSVVSTRNGEHELGIQHAADALATEPFDELACQALMRAHHAAGNRAEALRVYAACRKLFREELGADPSEKTTSVFLEILRGAK